jgi:hypothetical protein
MTAAEVIAHRERIAAEERTWAAAWRQPRDPAELPWKRAKDGKPYVIADGWLIVLLAGVSGHAAFQAPADQAGGRLQLPLPDPLRCGCSGLPGDPACDRSLGLGLMCYSRGSSIPGRNRHVKRPLTAAEATELGALTRKLTEIVPASPELDRLVAAVARAQDEERKRRLEADLLWSGPC